MKKKVVKKLNDIRKYVCEFFKSKYGFLCAYYEKLGVVDYLRTVTPMEKEYPRIRKWLNFFDAWKKKEGKNYVV